MPENEFVSRILDGFSKVKDEIDEKGGEWDFRYSLGRHILEDIFSWSRKVRDGHFKIERDRKDILFYDDSDPPLPVLIIETVNPIVEVGTHEWNEHIEKLKGYLKEVRCIGHGTLTNGHKLFLYNYDHEKNKTDKRLEIDIDQLVHKGATNLIERERGNVLQLSRILDKDRYVRLGDIEYFKKHRNVISLDTERGYDFFIEGLKKSLKEITGAVIEFFDAYNKREHSSGQILREAFENWKKSRIGSKAESKETFCKETSYILLNRILFDRICEDKRYIPKKISNKPLAAFLEEHIRFKAPYLELLEESFRIAEKEYGRIYQVKIFDWWRIEKAGKYTLGNQDKKLQEELEKDLNYVIRNALKRFNCFDFKTVNSDILGHVYEDYLPKEERKKLGEYYTPPEVVRYILDAVGYIAERDIEGKTLLDPACGSGTFLVETTKRLIRKLLSKLYGKYSIFDLDSDEASTLLETIRNCIYGLDINVFACHITEMNLFFQTIDLYEIIKKRWPEETFEGFNIFCTDSLLPIEPQITDFSDARVKPFLNDRKKIAEIKDMKFDFVVGNPPYVRVQRLTNEQKEQYKKIYEAPKANYDIYIVFIERGLRWLENNGKLGYITSDQYTSANYGEKLRKFIAENYKMGQFIDFADTGVFRDVTNYPSILILKRIDDKKEIKSNSIKCVRVRQPKDNLLKDIQSNLNKTEYFNEYYDLFDFPQSKLSDIWSFMPKNERSVFEKIENNADCRFKGIRERIFQGLTTSADKIYLVRVVEQVGDKLVKIRPVKSEKEYVVEKGILKPLLKGKDVRRRSIDWKDLWVIFPYKIVSGDAILYSEDEMEAIFPDAWQYFLYCKKGLEEREKGKMKNRKDWYGYIYKKNLKRFEQKKILVQVLANRNSFTLDENGIYYFMGAGGSNAYGILLNDEFNTAKDYLYFLGLLNSSVLEFYIKEISPLYSGRYYIYGRQYLEKLPIKLPKTPEKEKLAKEIIEKVERILKLRKELPKLEKKISEFSDSYARSKELHPLINIMKEQNITKESYSPSRLKTEIMEDIEGKTLYKVLLTKKDYIAFNTEKSAKFLFEMLRKMDRIIKIDLLKLRIPSDEDTENIMDKYQKDLEELEKINENIDILEKEIDEDVYRLYGLSDSDKKVIKNYL